ncbi:MAG: hypothetical protein Unbinned579contig1003_34 [Prokaryotic dsDNA virus sp.]|nr:MAG: hypothetical protein Unbinned579contig1003_34 [Prokaryotic dsDNA virus sp.]|tara:strand:+ start:3710 stop:4411 length:702 start_codon:yes stop_codon:yes gene_type:complete
MDIKEQIKVALGITKEVKLAFQAKTEDGTIVVSTAEELESGVDISVMTEDGTTIPLPPGTYKLDTGVSFRVEEEGIVSELIESETEEEDTPKEEEMAKEDEDKDKEDYEEEADVGDWEGMEKRIKNLEDAVADLKADHEEAGLDEEEEIEEELSAPGTNPKTIKTTEVKEFSAEDYEALKAENEKLKLDLAKSPAGTDLNTNKFSEEKDFIALSKKEIQKLSKKERFLYNLNK